MIKKIEKNILFIVLIFVFVISVGFSTSNEGVLKQTIYAPYDIVVANAEIGYSAGKSEERSDVELHSRYKDFGEKYDSGDLGIQTEPFCRYGGQYSINIFNDPLHSKIYNETETLFYCKTTKDLINTIKVPSSWSDSNLILYCNDGNLINFKTQNIDFLTTKLNNYKICIIKNLDLTSNNTILYGLEVGNFYVDSDSKYFFNSSNNNLLTNDFEIDKTKYEIDTTTVDESLILNYQKLDGKYVQTPNNGFCEEIYDFDSDTTSYENCITEKILDSFEVKEDIDDPTGYVGTTTVYNSYILTNSSALTQIKNQKGFGVFILSLNVLKRYKTTSPPKAKIQFSYKINFQETQNKYKNGFHLNYDSYNKMYSLTNSQENLDLSILEIFNNIPINFELSRIALFKNFKTDNKQIYGYDSVAKGNVINEEVSLKPVYKINFNGFNTIQNLCLKSLAHYGANSNILIGYEDKVICKNSEIYINSIGIDRVDGEGNGLNLFKNIILNII